MSLGPPLAISVPSSTAISAASNTAIGQKIDEKLQRAHNAKNLTPQIIRQRDAYIRAHLYRENALDQLRQNQPLLWERSLQTLDAEEQRLIAVGTETTLPAAQLSESTKRIESSLTKDLPVLSHAIITQVALGTVSDWLIRCPLDFPENQ